MFKRLLLCSFFFLSNCAFSNNITYSVMGMVDKTEKQPLSKFPENYIQETNEILKNKSKKIRIVTYNLLFDLFDDQQKEKTHTWPERMSRIVASINNMNPDILCVQETYPKQLRELENALDRNYQCFIGSSTTGELNAIFYNKARFVVDSSKYCNEIENASIDLPLNPKDDPLIARIPSFLPPELEPGKQLTLAHFQDNLTGKKFVVMNTHLTYFRVNSREDQAYFISNLAKKIQALSKPIILAGDFNTFPNRPDHPSADFYDGDYINHIFEKNLKDSMAWALLGHVGPLCTSVRNFYTRNDQPLQESENPGVIPDHIFVSPEITVLIHAIEPSQVNHYFPSDHLPVIADVLLP